MASPPFNINQALPGDSDIVSQHPTNARTFRDVVESWLGINHDTNGNHFRVDIPRSASPTTPAASVDVLYVSTTGRLKIKHPDGTEEFVGTPPGALTYAATATVPVGWLYANGQAVSRSTYADLFAAISTGWGSGDGSTTFNLPDLRGRDLVGVDDGAGRISTATLSAVTVGGSGGSETKRLIAGNIPSGVPVSISTVTVPAISVSVSGSITGTVGTQTASGSISGSASGGTVTGTPTGTISGTANVNSSSIVLKDGIGAQNLLSGTNGFGWSNNPTVGPLNSTGNITASFSGTGFSGGTIASPATVTGSFSGATVSTGAVSGTFAGSGSGTPSNGTGSGLTTGSSTGTVFSIMQPSLVVFPLIKT